MAIVDLDTELAAPAHAVWRAVKTPRAFRTVTRSVLTMPAIKHREDEWRESETVTGWVFLFGVIPFSRHTLHVCRSTQVSSHLPWCCMRAGSIEHANVGGAHSREC